MSSSNEDEHEHDHGYPMAELVICAGFFIIYLIEALVHRVFGLDHQHNHHVPSHKTKTDVENGPVSTAVIPGVGGVDNMAFNETDGPISSPPDRWISDQNRNPN